MMRMEPIDTEGITGMALDEDTVRLAKGKNLATVVTLMPDGQPQALLTWVDTDGEHILVNTEPRRQRFRNVTRNPRITVLIHSADNPRDWSEIRGHVVESVGGDDARRHIDELSRRYTGADYGNPIGPQGRVILKVAADKINTPKAVAP
jgi:PPOX class probable F420-dependent enzyme